MLFRTTCTQRSFLVVLGALLVELAMAAGAAPPAAAATLREPLLGFSMRLDVPGASVCTILPAGDRDAASCSGLDAAAIEEGVRAQAVVPSYFGIVRHEQRSFVVTAAAQPNMKPTAREDIADYVAGMAEGASALGAPARAHGATSGTSYDLLRVNGVDVIRSVVTVEVPEGHALYSMSRMITHAFVGSEGVALVTFSLSPQDLSHVRPVAEAMIGTASMPPLRQEGFGRSRAYLVGRSVGRVLGIVLGLALLAALVIRALRKKPSLP